jgi:ABC-type transport system involved in multi-copper enzyme maturation permease subunit
VRRVIWRELLDRKWPLFCYCLATAGLLWVYAATFKSSQASAQQLLQVVKDYPKALIEAFGLNSLASSSIEQYLNGKHFSFLWPLIAIAFALSLAAGQIAGQIHDRTLGLLLASPLRRLTILAAKYAAALAAIAVFTGLSVFPVVPLARAYGITPHPQILLAAWVLTTLFMWAVYALGLMVSAFSSRAGRVYALTGGILLVSYILNIVALLSDKWDWLKHYSLFYYFDTAGVLATGHLMASCLWVFAGTIVLATAVAAWQFNRRDIYL